MLTVDVKVNGSLIATITAHNMGQAPGTVDKPGDFVGEMSQPRTYEACVAWIDKDKMQTRDLTVTHDRRLGWQGLLHKITGEIMPTVVETIQTQEER
ncbi:MAG: hypothetical protein WC565_10690 [Parcubacteria group bacterium]